MDRLRTVELYRDNQRKVMAIESIEFNRIKSNYSCRLYGALSPIAIIVCTAQGNEVLVVDVDKSNIEGLRQIIPELDEMISLTCSDET